MDLQHLNKIEARLQDLEHSAKAQALPLALSVPSIEEVTLSDVLKTVLQHTKPENYSSVATQAAGAIKAAFKVLGPETGSVGLTNGGYVGLLQTGGSVSAAPKENDKEPQVISVAIEVDKTSLDDAESQLHRIAELAERFEKQPFTIKDGQTFINAAVINDGLVLRYGITALQSKDESEQPTLNRKESLLNDKLSRLEERVERLVIELGRGHRNIRGL
jgi:hypothetical protein